MQLADVLSLSIGGVFAVGRPEAPSVAKSG